MKTQQSELFISNVGFTWDGSGGSGCLVIEVKTPKHIERGGVSIYVTKTGKVRIFEERGEWQAPKEQK